MISWPTLAASPTGSSLLEPLPEADGEVFARMEAILRKIATATILELPHTEARALLVGLPTAEYVRVSSGRQRDRYGPPSQRRDIRRAVERYGLSEPSQRYEDHITATGKIIRTDFMKMRVDARSGRFKVLLVGRVDRFARNAMMGWLYIYELIACGVYVFFCDDDTVSGLDFGWKDRLTNELVKAEGFISTLTENVKKSVVERREAGKFVGQVPFGWQHGPHGPEHDPTQIGTVKRAFQIALENDKLKLASIAELLNAEGYRLENGRRFTKQRVHRMLTHPLAKGAWRIGKVGAKGSGKDSYDSVEGKAEPVVSPSQFELLQDLLADRALRRRSGERNRHEYVLARLLRCGETLPGGELCEAHFWGRPGCTKGGYESYEHAKGIGCCAASIETTYTLPQSAAVRQLQALFAQAHLPDAAVETISSYLAERDQKQGAPDRDTLLAAYQKDLGRFDFGFRHGAYGDDPLKAEPLWQRERQSVLAKIDALPPVPELPTETDQATVLDLFALWSKADNVQQRRLADAVFQKLYVTRDGGPQLTRRGTVRERGRAGIVRIVPRPEHALLLAFAFEGIKSGLPWQPLPVDGIWEARPFLGWLRERAA
ncbi:MAG: recombinase family protein [Chloroflexota bacterium]|nr:recombinase family protein [Chloroflexota bacterium]